ncbi:MAG: MlaD family protein [Kiritimatiellales bacterium]
MSDKYHKDLSIEVLVGFFMFIILIALGIFTIVLSRQNFLQKKYPVAVVFDEISGLRDGDNVYLHGTKVGTVKSTLLQDNQVIVRADLDVPVQFHEGYKVEVTDSSVLGGKQLKIYEGPLRAPPIPEGAVIIGKNPINILDELSAAVAGIKTLTDQITAGKGTLGKLIYDDAVYDNLKEVTERLVNGDGTLGKLLAKDDHLYQDLSATMANLRTITDKIEAGDGTLGKLVNDDQMYSEAQKLLAELRAAIDDMRETSPVTTFSTIFFGAF